MSQAATTTDRARTVPRTGASAEVPFDECPRCSSEHLTPEVETRSTVHFRCRGCGTAWHFELGHVRAVRPGAPVGARGPSAPRRRR